MSQAVEPFNYGARNGPTPSVYVADALAPAADDRHASHEPSLRACFHGLVAALLRLVRRR